LGFVLEAAFSPFLDLGEPISISLKLGPRAGECVMLHGPIKGVEKKFHPDMSHYAGNLDYHES